MSTTKDYVKLTGKINPADVYGKVSWGANGICDESVISVVGDAKIQFVCHGNKDSTTPAMIKTLQGMGKDLVKYETVKEKTWNPCKSGKDTCIGGWDYQNVDYTYFPRTFHIYLSNRDGGDIGGLSYTMSYAPGSPQCEACMALKFGSGFAAFVAGIFGPALGVPIGAIAQGVSGACLADGC